MINTDWVDLQMVVEYVYSLRLRLIHTAYKFVGKHSRSQLVPKVTIFRQIQIASQFQNSYSQAEDIGRLRKASLQQFGSNVSTIAFPCLRNVRLLIASVT